MVVQTVNLIQRQYLKTKTVDLKNLEHILWADVIQDGCEHYGMYMY